MGKLSFIFLLSIVKCCFSVFLVTVHDPICTEDGNLDNALYGSFLPIPKNAAFPVHPVEEYAQDKMPGAIIAKKERVTLNRGRARVSLRVTNNGDRPIQVRGATALKKNRV